MFFATRGGQRGGARPPCPARERGTSHASDRHPGGTRSPRSSRDRAYGRECVRRALCLHHLGRDRPGGRSCHPAGRSLAAVWLPHVRRRVRAPGRLAASAPGLWELTIADKAALTVVEIGLI